MPLYLLRAAGFVALVLVRRLSGEYVNVMHIDKKKKNPHFCGFLLFDVLSLLGDLRRLLCALVFARLSVHEHNVL